MSKFDEIRAFLCFTVCFYLDWLDLIFSSQKGLSRNNSTEL